MPSPLALRAFVLVLCLPAAALADDDLVGDAGVPPPSEIPYAGPSSTTVIVNVGVPATPVPATRVHAVAPVPVAPAPVIDPPAHAEDPCHWRAHAHARWRLPKRGTLGIGLSAGHVANKDDTEGRQKSVIARATGRRGFGIELELARTTLGDDTAKTIGGALVKSFGQRRLAPYVIAGGGKGLVDRADGSESHLKFGEIGGGLMLRGRRLAIGVDVRRGVRKVDAAELAPDAMPVDGSIERTVTPDDAHGERYTRARIVALVTF